MSVIAAALKHMLAAGMPHDEIVSAVADMEAAAAARSTRPPQSNEKVWVYVMGQDHPEAILVKVGISKHPGFRMITLEKERECNLYLAHTEGPFSRAEAAAIERQAHDLLAPHRESGEWFLCGAERAIETVAACARGAVQ